MLNLQGDLPVFRQCSKFSLYLTLHLNVRLEDESSSESFSEISTSFSGMPYNGIRTRIYYLRVDVLSIRVSEGTPFEPSKDGTVTGAPPVIILVRCRERTVTAVI